MRGILLGAVAIAACSSAAYADSGRGPGNDYESELAIVGHISPKCEISLPNRRIQTELTDGPGSESVAFQLSCNQALSVTMTSANGGFEHPTHDRNENFAGFTNFLPYRAAFIVNADIAQAVVAESEAMLAGAGGSIGTVPFNASGTLELSWSPDKPLLGGTFEDVIEIRVSGAGENAIPG